MANNKAMWAIIVIAVVLLVPGIRDPIFSFFKGAGTTTTTTQVGLTTCLDDVLSLRLNDEVLGVSSLDPSFSSAVFVDGTDYGDIADDGSVNVPVNAPYVVYGGWNAGTANNNYYTAKLSGNTDCRDPLQLNPKLARAPPGNAGNTNWSIYLSDWDGSVLSSLAKAGTDNVTLGANDDKTVILHLRVPKDYYFGNPEVGFNVMVLNGLKGLYDKLEVVNAIGPATTPKAHANGTNDVFAYKVPIVKNNEDLAIQVRMDTSGGAQPTNNISSGVWVTLYDSDYDLDADLNTEIKDVQDEDFNDLGQGEETRLYIRTA